VFGLRTKQPFKNLKPKKPKNFFPNLGFFQPCAVLRVSLESISSDSFSGRGSAGLLYLFRRLHDVCRCRTLAIGHGSPQTPAGNVNALTTPNISLSRSSTPLSTALASLGPSAPAAEAMKCSRHRLFFWGGAKMKCCHYFFRFFFLYPR